MRFIILNDFSSSFTLEENGNPGKTSRDESTFSIFVRSEPDHAIYFRSGEHINTLVKYDRAHNRLTVMGHLGATAEIFLYVERLEIDPQHLLGY